MVSAKLVFWSVLTGLLLGSAPVDAQEDEAEQRLTTRPVSRLDEDWWKQRHQEKLAAAKSMERVDLVLLGDSITHSWETVGKQVRENSLGELSVLNLGFSGDRTEHLLWRLQNGEVADIDPAVAMLMIGTNNTGHRLDPPADIAAGIQAILEELKTRLPNTKILLLAVFPFDKDPQSPRRRNNEAVNAMIRDFHDGQRVHYLDICERFFNDEGQMTARITPDFLHLSPAGYQIWADSIRKTLQKLVRRD